MLLNLPVWLYVITSLAVLLGALGVIWNKLVKPAANVISTSEQMIPLLRSLNKAFGDDANALSVLDEIAAQFRTDAGSSLRDVINRLEAAAVHGKEALDATRRTTEELRVEVKAARIVTDRERDRLDSIILILDRLVIRVEAGDSKRDRIAETIAQLLEDQAASHRRADENTAMGAGSAADAAARTAEGNIDSKDREEYS